MMISGDTEEVDDNLTGWQLFSISSTKIEIDLEFEEPLEVSQGDSPDKLLLICNLEELKDENLNSMPPGIIKILDIPA